MPSQREEAFYILGIATGCIIAGIIPYFLMFFISVHNFEPIFIIVTPIFIIGLGVLLLIIGYFYKG